MLTTSFVALGSKRKLYIHELAIQNASNAVSDVHFAYLQCYALQENAKTKCKQLVQESFNLKSLDKSQEYWLYYAYESERLGFKWFLNKNNKVCDKIEEGPLFNHKTNSYEVICIDRNKFKMSFDYENNKWILVD